MDAPALLARFRLEADDRQQPYLWSDEEVLSYLNDAQDMFCREQGGIADSSSAVTRLTCQAGDEFVEISPRILKLRYAARADGYRLELLNFEDLEARQAVDDYGYRAGLRLDNTPGEIKALVLGMEANRVRLIHIPLHDQEIRLIVYRMPLQPVTADQPELEIDEHHHLHLIDWMRHLAHLKQDAETYDRGRAQEFGDRFLAYCRLAREERERREHKYRTVAYGGY